MRLTQAVSGTNTTVRRVFGPFPRGQRPRVVVAGGLEGTSGGSTVQARGSNSRGELEAGGGIDLTGAARFAGIDGSNAPGMIWMPIDAGGFDYIGVEVVIPTMVTLAGHVGVSFSFE